jgi:hypothetical protein
MPTEIIYKNLDGDGQELRNWSGEKLTTDPTGGGLYQGREWFNTTDGVKRYYDGAAIQTVATIADIASLGKLVGGHDASTGIPTTGSGTSGAINQGDQWRVTVGGTIAGIGGEDVLEVGDLIVAVNAGASTSADFFVLQTNLNLGANISLTEEVTLASLPANTATAVPTTFTNVYSIEAYNSAGEKIGLCHAGAITAPTVESSRALTNITLRVVGN